MKKRIHFSIILLGTLLFGYVSYRVGETLPAVLSWYHYPFVFPVMVALLFGGGGESLNATAGNIAVVFECVLFGFFLDAVVIAVRKIRKKGSGKNGA